MRASELIHEIRNHSVKMKTIIKPVVRQINEIVSCDGHGIREKLNLEVPHGSGNGRNFVRHLENI